MLLRSGCSAVVDVSRVPAIRGAVDLLDEHAVIPNSAERTYQTLADRVAWAGIPFALRMLLCDPQTSGGLLLGVEPSQVDEFVGACARKNREVAVVGEITTGEAGHVRIRS
jgi:selenide,water dikinase